MTETLEFKKKEVGTETYVEIPTDIVLMAAQYFAFHKKDPVTATRLLVKAQQTGMVGNKTPFRDEDEELIEKLKELKDPEAYSKARCQLFLRTGLDEEVQE